MDHLVKFIDTTLGTRIAPVAYLVVLSGWFRGLSYTFFQGLDGVGNTILFKISSIPVTFWGVFILIASTLLIGGMLLKSHTMVMVGSMGMIMNWVFTSIAYFTNGYHSFLFVTAVLNALMYGYFFVAAPLNRLWDYSPKAVEKVLTEIVEKSRPEAT